MRGRRPWGVWWIGFLANAGAVWALWPVSMREVLGLWASLLSGYCLHYCRVHKEVRPAEGKREEEGGELPGGHE
jgi:hypothetical protein